MIKKILVRGFKKFAKQEFEIPGHLVVAGPNNSGKTSLLQAVLAWTEIALRWSFSTPDMARDKTTGNYLATNITVDSFGSIPLADFDHLWTDQKTERPLVVQLETERWNIGFECLRKEKELVAARPVREVKEKVLESFLKDVREDSLEESERSWEPVYIPPISGVEVQEELLGRGAAVLANMARGNAGKVLRNLLWRVRQNGHWDDLNEIIEDFFGYKLMTLSSERPFLAAPYRHSPEEAASYDLSSAASGFLQVLLVYAAIFGRRSAVYLMDEPDAHLHLSLRNKLFRDLLERARKDGFQMIVATHSERLIRETQPSNLRLLDARGTLRAIPRSNMVAAMKLDQAEILETLREPQFLYLEGSTDIKLLIAWAKILGHRCLPFLERTTPIKTAQMKKERAAAAHFSARHAIVSNVRGVELRDGDRCNGDPKMPAGLKLLSWKRKEIESYLLHPKSVIRHMRSMTSEKNVEKAQQYMEIKLPPELFGSPCGEQLFLKDFPIKDFFSALFQETGLSQATSKDYLLMAGGMKPEEIHPEVRDKLDRIAEHLGIQEGKAGSQVNATTGKSDESKT